MGTERREERRKVGPADPATRNRMLADALAGTTKPRDTSGSVAGSRTATPAPRPAKPAEESTIKNAQDGVRAIKNRRRDLNAAIEEAGG